MEDSIIKYKMLIWSLNAQAKLCQGTITKQGFNTWHSHSYDNIKHKISKKQNDTNKHCLKYFFLHFTFLYIKNTEY